MNGPGSHFKVPTRHKSDGVSNADFISYAAARPSGTDSRAVWAATCNTLSDLRPSIGAMNFYSKYMTDTAWSVRVAAHEIAHALWFSQESMEDNSLVKKRERSVRGTHRRMVAGKHVQEKAKAHFGCDSRGHGAGGRRLPSGKSDPSLEGTPRAGRADGTHSRCRLLHGSDDGGVRGYGILPRELEHGGADELGHRSVCDFLEKKCNTADNLAAKYPHMFCDAKDTETLRCTSDRRHVGTCTASIVEDKGSLLDKDVCPVVSLEFHEISSGTTYRTCSDENVDYLRGSLTGGGSWCLDAELLETKDGNGHKSVKGVCAQVSCEEGTDIPVTLKYFQKEGKINCPRYGEVCTIAANGSSLVIPRRWWVDRVTSKRRKQKSLRLLQGRLLRRILVHSCLLWRLVPPLKRSLPVLRLRVSLVVA
ncbi:surface protease GP63, partial [Trypanosoma cruzi]